MKFDWLILVRLDFIYFLLRIQKVYLILHLQYTTIPIGDYIDGIGVFYVPVPLPPPKILLPSRPHLLAQILSYILLTDRRPFFETYSPLSNESFHQISPLRCAAGWSS